MSLDKTFHDKYGRCSGGNVQQALAECIRLKPVPA